MAPKGKQQEPKKAKATVDDKTFGMKNKKGGQAQRAIAQLQAQQKSNKSPEEKKKEAEKEQKAKEKAAADAAKVLWAAAKHPRRLQAEVSLALGSPKPVCVHQQPYHELGRLDSSA